MLTVAVPLAVSALVVILVLVAVLVVAALAYAVISRGDRRSGEVDAERERVAEQQVLEQPIDFQREFRRPEDRY